MLFTAPVTGTAAYAGPSPGHFYHTVGPDLNGQSYAKAQLSVNFDQMMIEGWELICPWILRSCA